MKSSLREVLDHYRTNPPEQTDEFLRLSLEERVELLFYLVKRAHEVAAGTAESLNRHVSTGWW